MRAGGNQLQVRCFLAFQFRFNCQNTSSFHGHAGQFHLDDGFEARQHQISIDVLLVVSHHHGVVGVFDVPRTQTVHKVVLKQVLKRNLTNIFDVRLCPVACKGLSQ